MEIGISGPTAILPTVLGPLRTVLSGFLLLMVLARCDCGTGPITLYDAAGTYAGNRITVGSCTDRTSLLETADAGFKVAHEGTGVKVETGEGCSPVLGDLRNNTSNVVPLDCPVRALADGGSRYDRITGGTFSFREKEMAFTFRLAVSLGHPLPALLADGGTAGVEDAGTRDDGGIPDAGITCSGMTAGTLKRK